MLIPEARLASPAVNETVPEVSRDDPVPTTMTLFFVLNTAAPESCLVELPVRRCRLPPSVSTTSEARITTS